MVEQKGKDSKNPGGVSKFLSKGKTSTQAPKEEVKKEEDVEKKVDENSKKVKEDTTDWEYLYGAFELFTDNRRRNQTIIIKNLIFKIKEKFNKEFEKLINYRQSQVDNINEKNNRIKEILKELKINADLFEPKKTLMEK